MGFQLDGQKLESRNICKRSHHVTARYFSLSLRAVLQSGV